MDRETAIRRLTNRYNEQCDLYPLMREVPLRDYITANLPFILGSQLGDDALKDYDVAA